MKTIKKIFFLLAFSILVPSCNDGLDLLPKDKLTADDLFGDPAGAKLYMADLYDRLPIEDFTFFPGQGFNFNPVDPNNAGITTSMMTMTAIHSEGNPVLNSNQLNWWGDAYVLIRDVNLLIDAVPTLNISDEEKKLYIGETSFIRAFAYFGLVKRYGGVPILLKAQDYNGDAESLKVPRNTEQETWDFVLAECDIAIKNLGVSNGRRASKWAALALKSRAALYAASIAKYGENVALTGEAVNLKLVGLPSNTAARYYEACIDASNEIMTKGPYSLYKPNPSSVDEAAENYRLMFANPNIAPEEAILIKGRTIVGAGYGNNYDIWYGPNQKKNGWPHPGRYCPTLEFVDMFENYSNPGQDAPVVTTLDGNTENYDGYKPTRNYIHYTNPVDIFAGKDARLKATIILPMSVWKGDVMIYQAGLIKPNGDPLIDVSSRVKIGTVTYFTFGSQDPDQHSGFNLLGGNCSKTGFGFKKFLSTEPVISGWNNSFTDFAEFRYAEILLNYAEAVVESGLGDPTKAVSALNATRKRAFHRTNIPLTIKNVLRERTVELSFENKEIWDLIRRRTYHTTFNNTRKHALKPVLDLRGAAPYQYIFIRDRIQNTDPLTADINEYYRDIPGIGLNGLVPNPN